MKSSKGKQVLVVDDSRTIRVVMKDFLKEVGFTNIVEAEDGDQAVSIFRKLRPEIVFLDLELPKIEGDKVARQILDLAPRSKVIIVSAEDLNEVRKSLLRIGVYDYLNKPVKFEEIARLAERLNSEIPRRQQKKLPSASKVSPGATLVEYSPAADPSQFRSFLEDLASGNERVHLFTSPNSLLQDALGRRRNVWLHTLTISEGSDKKWRGRDIAISIRDPSRVADDISSVLEDTSGGRPLILFDGLTDSIVQVGFETTYSLLKEILTLLRRQKVTALFFLNAQAHDDRQVAAIRGVIPKRLVL